MRLSRLRGLYFGVTVLSASWLCVAARAETDDVGALGGAGSGDRVAMVQAEAAMAGADGAPLEGGSALKAELFAIATFALLAHVAHRSARKARQPTRSG